MSAADRRPSHRWPFCACHTEDDLGDPVEGVCAEFNPDAVAAASLGQVYRARLRDDREVTGSCRDGARLGSPLSLRGDRLSSRFGTRIVLGPEHLEVELDDRTDFRDWVRHK
jgi:ABC1 atypical kinase-like domain